MFNLAVSQIVAIVNIDYLISGESFNAPAWPQKRKWNCQTQQSGLSQSMASIVDSGGAGDGGGSCCLLLLLVAWVIASHEKVCCRAATATAAARETKPKRRNTFIKRMKKSKVS